MSNRTDGSPLLYRRSLGVIGSALALVLAAPVARAATESTAGDPALGNNFFGFEAGLNNTGPFATFFGHQAGASGNSGAFNTFFGSRAGSSNTTGVVNSFFGAFAGAYNTTGSSNAFFGSGSGENNSVGSGNSFFGEASGFANTEGFNNAFFGQAAGLNNTTACCNTFLGFAAGYNNIDGGSNVFVGDSAGRENSVGAVNTFVGAGSGAGNLTGVYNVFLGGEAGLANTGEYFNTLIGALSNISPGVQSSTAIGFRAQVDQSDSLVLGGVKGVNGVEEETKVGIGTTTPQKKLHVAGDDADGGQNNDVALRIQNTTNVSATRRMVELINFGSPQLIFSDLSRNEAWQLNPVGNQFTISALGGGVQLLQMRTDGRTTFRSTTLGASTPTMLINGNGNVTIAGTLTQGSDVNTKRDIEPVNAQTLLDKVASLPVSTWEYKTDAKGVRHLGPMAQDFREAFGLGDDPTKLAPGDVAGVALAAIQALRVEVESQRADMVAMKQASERKDAELSALRAELRQTQAVLHKVDARLNELNRRNGAALIAAGMH